MSVRAPLLLLPLACLCPAVAARAAGLHYEATGQFRLEIPEGFVPIEEPPQPPVTAAFARPLWQGEALLLVERYDAGGGAARDSFLRNLDTSRPVKSRRRRSGERAFEVYEVQVIETWSSRLPPQDPFHEALGGPAKPPRISVFESRRYLPGGEAYKLYRCRELGLWPLLKRYRKARASGAGALEGFRSADLDAAARKAVAACFGAGVLTAMDRGEPVEEIPKPSLYRLRILARDEWRSGSDRRVDYESVHLRETASGFYALRFRAPSYAFKTYYSAYLEFIAGFKVLD